MAGHSTIGGRTISPSNGTAVTIHQAIVEGCKNTFEIQEWLATHINVFEEWCDIEMFYNFYSTKTINAQLDFYHIPCERLGERITDEKERLLFLGWGKSGNLIARKEFERINQ